MIPDYSEKSLAFKARLESFMEEHIYPNEARFYRESEDLGPWAVRPIIEELKVKARAEGLWNLLMTDPAHGAGLSVLDYAPLCEIMGRSHLAPEVFNCNAPDTGNMDVLARYGSDADKKQWLEPLLNGEIRSAFAMTEPAVASSDARNIASSIVRDGDEYVINGHKWYTTGATDPRCKIIIFMGKTDPEADTYRQQSMILVPKDTPGVTVKRAMPVFGFYGTPDRASEVVFENVRVPAANLLLGEGRGFEIAQEGWLGPGRIQHCMRLIGLAERTLEKMIVRAEDRVAFGKLLSEQSVTRERIAESRIRIEQARLLTLRAAHLMDVEGIKGAKAEVAMVKAAVPSMACQVVDWAIQLFGGGGTNNDFGLTSAYATARLLRLADGPDEVHRDQIARLEYKKLRNRNTGATSWDRAVSDIALGTH